MTSFMLEIITPEGKLFASECLQVDVPGTEGRMGILANHMNLVSALLPGLVEIYQNDQVVKKFVVADGILEVKSGKCIILVEQANNLENLNAEELNNKIEAAKHNLNKATTKAFSHSLTTELLYLEELLKHAVH
jgi:F-type H+-transporting ATPase subunit epsilon